MVFKAGKTSTWVSKLVLMHFMDFNHRDNFYRTEHTTSVKWRISA